MIRLCCMLFGLLAYAAVQAQPHDSGAAALVDAFSQSERIAIEAYFESQRRRGHDAADDHDKKSRHEKRQDKQLPPGLAKRDTLPPGLAKQLQRNGTLPPGLAKRDLPRDLERQLPALREGRRRVVVGDDVLLIEATTEVILDILYGVAGD